MEKKKLIKILKKHKTLVIVLFLVFYTLFWWWFFNEKNIAIDKSSEYKEQMATEKKNENNNKNKKDNDSNVNELNFSQLGNFWLEINTDKLKIKAPIINGVTDNKLSQGIGHHKTTAFPNREKGNVVLAGHRWKFGKNPAYKVFENLDKLKKGDKIVIHYNNQKFVYKVSSERITGGKDMNVLKQTDKPVLTLYTCTPKFTALKRLVFQAELLNK